MTNEVANRTASTAMAALGGLKAGLQNVSQTVIATGGDPFLRLQGDGTWVYSAENIEVEPGSRWAVNPFSLMHGWVAWTDRPGKQANEIVGEVMVSMQSALPPEAELAKVDGTADNAHWAQQLSFQMKCTNGEDAGEQVLYKTTSVGGMNAMKKIINAIMQQLDVDTDHPVPLIELKVDSYMHKKWGKTFTPIFDVKAWASLDGDEDTAEDIAAAEEARKAEAIAAAAAKAAEAKPRTRKAGASVPVTKAPEPDQDADETEEEQLDPAEARKRALMAELAELTGGKSDQTVAASAATVAAAAAGGGERLRRRRNA